MTISLVDLKDLSKTKAVCGEKLLTLKHANRQGITQKMPKLKELGPS